MLASGAIDVVRGQHIDGTVQVDGGGCTACHGTQGVNPAPPVGTNDETATTQRAVGAHQKHVRDGAIRKAFGCSACHAPVSDLTHANDVISLPFDGLASQGTTPSWTGTTCSSTYCHGATLGAGGSTTAPTWTAVSAGPTACGSCHGFPPPLPHPQNPDCGRCHSDTVLAGGGIDLAGGRHIDGTLQVNGGGCTLCHGTEGVNPAPPAGTKGETLTTQRAVGRTRSTSSPARSTARSRAASAMRPSRISPHDGTISLPFAGARVEGHDPGVERDDLQLDVLPRRDRSARVARRTADVDGGVARPDGLRLLPRLPAAVAAPAGTDCNRCHSGTVSPGERSISRAASTSTARCRSRQRLHRLSRHGERERGAAGRHEGGDAHHQRAVGAHQKHVVTGTIRNAFACGACHAPVSDLTHVNGVDLPAVHRARVAGNDADLDRHDLRHDVLPRRDARGGRLDTRADLDGRVGRSDCCGSCHGAPLLPHPQNTDCNRCHSGTVLAGGGSTSPAASTSTARCRSPRAAAPPATAPRA